MKYLQIQSIKILNSKYRILFILITYGFIYCFFYYDKAIVMCMNETNIPSIAESKSSLTRSVINREVSAFWGYSKEIEEYKQTIEEQKVLIKEQQKSITEYKKELAFNQDMLRLIAGDDHVADAIADRGLEPYINTICKKHGKPLWYPWLEDPSQY